MAALVDIQRRTSPVYRRSGNEGGIYEAEWFLEIDDFVPAERAIQLGQASASTERLPQRGDDLRWVSDTEVYRDAGALALDFRAERYRPDKSDNRGEWLVTVTWRPPKPGNDEQPGTFRTPPLARPPEYWIEYDTIEHTYSQGYVVDNMQMQLGDGPTNWINLVPTTAKPIFGPLRNAAGEGFTVQASRLLPVVVKQYNVHSDLVGLQLNNDFESTVNDQAWKCRGLSVAAHHARFIRAETSQQIFEDNWRFYRLQVRVAIGRTPFYHIRPHRATKFFNPPNYVGQQFVNADGFIEQDGWITKSRGAKATTQSGFGEVLRWLLYDPVNYDSLRFI